MPKTVNLGPENEEISADRASNGLSEGLSIEQMTASKAGTTNPKKSGKSGKWMSWLVLLILLLAFTAGAYYGRNFVVQIWPGSASIYQSLKIDVETSNQLGLEIHNLTTKSVLQNGVTTLTVTGTIKNITEANQPLPRINIALINDKGERVYSWTTTVEEREVGPWGEVDFSTSMNQPPEEAENVKVDLIDIGK
jgi:hypothetical protein